MCFDRLLLDLAVSGDMYLVQYFSMQLYYTYKIFSSVIRQVVACNCV